MYRTIDWQESDFRFDVTVSRWRPLRHFLQKSAATWWVNTKRLPAPMRQRFVSSWSIVHSYFLLLCALLQYSFLALFFASVLLTAVLWNCLRPNVLCMHVWMHSDVFLVCSIIKQRKRNFLQKFVLLVMVFVLNLCISGICVNLVMCLTLLPDWIVLVNRTECHLTGSDLWSDDIRELQVSRAVLSRQFCMENWPFHNRVSTQRLHHHRHHHCRIVYDRCAAPLTPYNFTESQALDGVTRILLDMMKRGALRSSRPPHPVWVRFSCWSTMRRRALLEGTISRHTVLQPGNVTEQRQTWRVRVSPIVVKPVVCRISVLVVRSN